VTAKIHLGLELGSRRYDRLSCGSRILPGRDESEIARSEKLVA
jgi:hypothetical protein